MSHIDFCENCRQQSSYTLKTQQITRTIRDKKYTFNITVATCDHCNQEMSPHGLIDQNVQEIDSQYREQENIVTVSDIQKLMQIYKIGNRPLSLTLGFGEITIARYLEGQVPSKEYSDIIKKAVTLPAYMQELLELNRAKLTESAYSKAWDAAESLKTLFSVSDKIISVIDCLFYNLQEITPLMLQKLLYYCQGVYSAKYGRLLFPEECRAWLHGPVYPKIYDIFKRYHYNPIDYPEFVVIDGARRNLTPEEREIVDLVSATFGLYGAKVLEQLTHKEEPWTIARKGYGDGISSNTPISQESIVSYFQNLKNEYDISTKEGLLKYITANMEES